MRSASSYATRVDINWRNGDALKTVQRGDGEDGVMMRLVQRATFL